MKNKMQKIKQLLNMATSELNKYKNYRKFGNISQACEKTWVAFTLLMEYISGQESRSINDTKSIADQYNYALTFSNCRYLHILHYEGCAGISEDQIIRDVESTIHEVRGIVIKVRR